MNSMNSYVETHSFSVVVSIHYNNITITTSSKKCLGKNENNECAVWISSRVDGIITHSGLREVGLTNYGMMQKSRTAYFRDIGENIGVLRVLVLEL